MKYLSHTAILYYRWQNARLSVQSIMATLLMQDDLTSLIRWASKKRLRKVEQGYIWQHQQLEERLWLYRVRNRALFTFCEFLLTAYKQLMPTPKYYKRGSAAQYRLS
jgi:hypothetical protein